MLHYYYKFWSRWLLGVCKREHVSKGHSSKETPTFRNFSLQESRFQCVCLTVWCRFDVGASCSTWDLNSVINPDKFWTILTCWSQSTSGGLSQNDTLQYVQRHPSPIIWFQLKRSDTETCNNLAKANRRNRSMDASAKQAKKNDPDQTAKPKLNCKLSLGVSGCFLYFGQTCAHG